MRAVNQDKKPKRNKGNTKFESKNQSCTSRELTGINWIPVVLILLLISCLFFDMRVYLSAEPLLFSFFCKLLTCWLNLCCLVSFNKLWANNICGWVINNLNEFLTKFKCCYMFTIAFCCDSSYLKSLFRLPTHLIIQVRKEPQNGLS